MPDLDRFRRTLDRFPWLRYAAFFAVALLVHGFVLWEASYADPDSFYHAKMAVLLQQHGIIFDFIWLPFTTLATAFADHHLLYHWLLVPFVGLLGAGAGSKVATAIFAAAALTAFYRLLRVLGGAFPLFFAALLGTSATFVFRLDLTKATAVSLVILFLAFAAWRQGRRGWLFVLSWIYVWTHGGWPLMAVVAAALAAGDLVVSLSDTRTYFFGLFRKRPARRPEWLAKIAACLAGLAAGLIINPYFPKNLAFYWEQIVQIAIINFRGKIGVGSEWYPYPFIELFGGSGTVFVTAGLCLVGLCYVVFWCQPPSGSSAQTDRRAVGAALAAVLLAGAFFLLTLRSRRHVEYFVPFALLAESLVLGALLRWIDLRSLLRRFWSRRRPFAAVLLALCVVYFAAFFGSSMVRGITGVRRMYLNKAIPWTRYQPAADWLRSNSPAGAIVFHSDWDDFPPLFFHNDRNRYIIGLDPTFLYRSDPSLYAKYVGITTGAQADGAGEIIVGDFDSRYVIIEKDHEKMRELLAADRRARLVYDDREVWIYELK